MIWLNQIWMKGFTFTVKIKNNVTPILGSGERVKWTWWHSTWTGDVFTDLTVSVVRLHTCLLNSLAQRPVTKGVFLRFTVINSLIFEPTDRCCLAGRTHLQKGGANTCRWWGRSKAKIPTKKQLDAQLDKYMSMSKSRLDKQLDDYMSMSKSRLDADLDEYMSMAGQTETIWDWVWGRGLKQVWFVVIRGSVQVCFLFFVFLTHFLPTVWLNDWRFIISFKQTDDC